MHHMPKQERLSKINDINTRVLKGRCKSSTGICCNSLYPKWIVLKKGFLFIWHRQWHSSLAEAARRNGPTRCTRNQKQIRKRYTCLTWTAFCQTSPTLFSPWPRSPAHGVENVTTVSAVKRVRVFVIPELYVKITRTRLLKPIEALIFCFSLH